MNGFLGRKEKRILKLCLILSFYKKKKKTTEEDYDAFCLAYMFTYRDFEMGTLGLAWTGDLKNAGGVCEKNGVSSITRNENGKWLQECLKIGVSALFLSITEVR